MPETLSLACPSCGKPMKAPAEVAGKKIRCKGCGEIFVAKAGPAQPTKAAKPGPTGDGLDEEFGDGKPYGVTVEKLGHRCPECANEMESEEAIVCLKCGYNTRSRARMQKKRIADKTGMDQFLWLLPGIISVLILLTLIIWDILYLLKADVWFDKDSFFSFLSYGGIKLWSTLVTIVIMFICAKVAIKRLILHPVPPEVEIRG